MIRFVKNVGYGLFHFCVLSGRDSRQTFCDIYKGLLLLAFLGVFVALWRNTLAILYLRDFFAISDTAYWILLALFEVFLLVAFLSAVVRRWQDLDIRIPKDQSVMDLISHPRFWQVLVHEEGSLQRNLHGESPKDTPVPIISDRDLPDMARPVEKSIELQDVEELK